MESLADQFVKEYYPIVIPGYEIYYFEILATISNIIWSNVTGSAELRNAKGLSG